MYSLSQGTVSGKNTFPASISGVTACARANLSRSTFMQATRTRGRPAWRARLGYTRARLHVVSSLFSLAIADN